ncbi:MAG: winged helix-turn-helix domain-containing protein [Candidatus Pacearchaeota archaeon]
MSESTYLLADLNDEQAEILGNVIANKTSRKILNLLSKRDLAISDIAKELNLPISTISYNIKKLSESNLVKIKDYYWSEKGNKMPIYSLTKKLILISPEKKKIKRKKIRDLISVFFISFGISVAIKLIYPRATFKFRESAVEKSSELLKKGVEEASSIAIKTTENMPLLYSLVKEATNYALFFFAGALLAILLYLFFSRKDSN